MIPCKVFVILVSSILLAPYAVAEHQNDDHVLKMSKLVPAMKLQDVEKTGCKCANLKCACCVRVHIKEIKFDEDACVSFAYLPKDIGIQVTLVIGKFVVFNKIISARNPPPICLDVPYLHHQAHLCLSFHDLQISNKKFSGCVAMEVKVLKFIHKKFEFGCFNIPIPFEEIIQSDTIKLPLQFVEN